MKSVNKIVRRRLRRVAFDALHKESTSYSQIINSLSAFDLKEAKLNDRTYWNKLVTALGDGLRYGWHASAVGEKPTNEITVTLPSESSSPEDFLLLEAVRVGSMIGWRHRHEKPQPTHG